MILSQKSAESLAVSRAQPLLQASAVPLGAGSNPMRVDAVSHRRLEVLLSRLGLAVNPVASQCAAHLDGATEHAVANITAWLVYLPRDCVRSMVRDGWHWST